MSFVERWLDTTVEACASHCVRTDDFQCRSFNYHSAKRLCTISESNVGLSGKLVADWQWDFYELASESTTCPDRLRCPSGKCLTEEELCDGKDDCGNKFDEQSCRHKPNLRIRLVGGRNSAEGRVEVKAFDYAFGGICDDGFGLAEASVVCRQLGFTMGAEKAEINSHFGSGSGQILMDEVRCTGNESDLLSCRFSPWGKHDCTENEWAGVVCKYQRDDCEEDRVSTNKIVAVVVL